MRLLPCMVLALALTAGAGSSSAADKPETSHLAFVTEYIRELAAIENIRYSIEKEQGQSKESESFANAIHGGTAMQLELRSQIGMLNSMPLNTPFDELIPDIIAFDEEKIRLYQRLIDISGAFLAGPKPNVDYGKLAAEVPKIRTQLEYIDHSLFDTAPLVFAVLIDQKPDSKNHVNHLIITRAERAKLIGDLNRDFGAKLEQKDQNYTVGTASVLRSYFLKDYKCSDDPWE